MVQTDRIMTHDPVTTPRLFNSAKSSVYDQSDNQGLIQTIDKITQRVI